MNRIRLAVIISLASVLFFSVILLLSCKQKSPEGMIVFTQVSGKMQYNISGRQDSAGQTIQSRIVALKNDKSSATPDVLAKGFYSARSPEISFDAAKMLFCAKQKQDDKWHIWEMDLSNLKTRQITSLPENCFDPAYLPNGRVIFSMQRVKENHYSGLTMFSCNPDGSDIRQVTFDPYIYSSSTVLKDGRVLTICSALNPDDDEPLLRVLRPDGTKNELFFKSCKESHPGSRAWETASGKIVFIESEKENAERGEVISISYNRPLNSYTNITSGIEGSFNSVFPMKSGKILVSYRKSESERYGLYEFDPETKTLSQALYENKDFDVAEIVAVEKEERPKKLPSEVDMGVKTGLLLCQDVAFHDINQSLAGNVTGINKIRISGKDSTLGEIAPEKDGSFYLKVIADTPFQIQAIDDNGNVVGKPCGWIYLRPNERRGCIGCHEDHELVPENKVPLAVKFDPVNIPVHIKKVVEKKVSLE